MTLAEGDNGAKVMVNPQRVDYVQQARDPETGAVVRGCVLAIGNDVLHAKEEFVDVVEQVATAWAHEVVRAIIGDIEGWRQPAASPPTSPTVAPPAPAPRTQVAEGVSETVGVGDSPAPAECGGTSAAPQLHANPCARCGTYFYPGTVCHQDGAPHATA